MSLTGCEGAYSCGEWIIIVDEEGYLHLSGEDCEYEYIIPLPEEPLTAA